MKYDFDTIIDRHGTDCIKFDHAEEFKIPQENLSLWVADMDFPTAPCITQALEKIIQKGIFGYTASGKEYYQAVSGWYRNYFGWETKEDWLIQTPGVVFALATAVNAFSKPGEKVLIQQPVYYPFANVVQVNGRTLVNSPLVLEEGPDGGRYKMNFADLKEKMKDPALKMMILCSPHNPVGRVWTKEELIRLEELCLAHDVILVSDEIHSDFIRTGHTHSVLASLDERYEKNTVICTAPSKTFNLAGLQLSNIFIPDEQLRCTFKDALSRTGFFGPNQMGLAACQAAYEGGREWLEQAWAYIQENIAFTEEFINTRLPVLKMIRPEGTYLLWIDCRGLGLSSKELDDLIVQDAHLWLDAGPMFGKEGEGFQRINAACSRLYLKQALEQLEEAVKNKGIL